jgi:hypothetical protein
MGRPLIASIRVSDSYTPTAPRSRRAGYQREWRPQRCTEWLHSPSKARSSQSDRQSLSEVREVFGREVWPESLQGGRMSPSAILEGDIGG